MGDVVITNSTTIPQTTPITPCTINNQDISDMIYGRIQEKDINGSCTETSSTILLDLVTERMQNISTKLTGKGNALTDNERKFIETTSLPIFTLLQQANKSQTTPQTIANLKRVIALSYAMSIFDDLQRQTQQMFEQIQADVAQANLGNDPDCQLNIYAHATREFAELSKRAAAQRNLLLKSYNTEIATTNTYIQILKDHINNSL